MAGEVTDAHIDWVKNGSTEAWSFVRESFEAGLRAKALNHLKSSSLKHVSADDLVQETWLKAWNKKDSFRGTRVPEFIKWLLAILKNTFIDKCRQGSFELTEPTIVENTIGPSKTPSETVRMAERDMGVATVLSNLDRVTREIIRLKHFEGLTFREIGDKLGKNPNSVASIYRRALVNLKLKLADGSSMYYM